ncbi:MAG TPA: hypothetical protein VMH80_27105 [Bryobacteraceae bacterium]|nr:hypothetical protein [Bryobacteraceae bacterium]
MGIHRFSRSIESCGIAALLVLTSAVSALGQESELTFGLFNGRHWNKYSQAGIQLPEMPKQLPAIPPLRPDGVVTTGDIKARDELQMIIVRKFGELYADAQVQRSAAAMWEEGILEGIIEGWSLHRQVNGPTAPEKYALNPGSTRRDFSDLAAMITSVYRDNENLDLPIGWVTLACFAIWRGETTRETAFPVLRRYLQTVRASVESQKGDTTTDRLDPMPAILSVSKQ